jgi:tetratricopeptide (TPR) repeat protein
LDLPAIVRMHRTPIFHNARCDSLTPLGAMQSYLTFAQEQLSFAGGGEVAGSMALYGLGKLHKTLAEKATPGVCAARTKAVVFYQASLLVSPRNYMASNDLGVLLAQAGRCEDARAALEHSLTISPQPTGWRNLAVVYSQLGEVEAARKANLLAEAGGSAPSAAAGQADGDVRWVDPYAFARAVGQTLPPPPADSAAADSPPKQAADWLPWKTHDARK